MSDQASDLRQLAMRRECGRLSRVGRTAVLAVAGGKGGVGTTTIAIAIARALADAGDRVALVDAAPNGNAAMLCGIVNRRTLDNVLEEGKPLSDVAQVGPDGILVLAAGHRWQDSRRAPAAAASRSLELLGQDENLAKVAVVDVGAAMLDAATQICRTADAVLMVTTAEAPAMIGTLEAIKTFAGGAQSPANASIFALVNKTRFADTARRAFERLEWASRRLAGVRLRSAGHVSQTRPLGACLRRKRHHLFPIDTIRLNLPARTVDTLRRVLVADRVLSWRSRVESNGPTAPNLDEPVHVGMDF